jgi:hypothetical protein
MEEIYPGMNRNGGGFQVNGFAKTLPPPSRSFAIQKGVVIVGFHSVGRPCFFVQQSGISPDPSFSLWHLTIGFLCDAIQNDPTFTFSVTSPRVGDVTYISGAEARDYGGHIQQGMISLHATGGWSTEGLKLSINGQLGDRSAFLGKPIPEGYQNASYEIDLNIPWHVLRFLFYEQKYFVLSNHQKFCTKT